MDSPSPAQLLQHAEVEMAAHHLDTLKAWNVLLKRWIANERSGWGDHADHSELLLLDAAEVAEAMAAMDAVPPKAWWKDADEA
jgi:hypothetical protein